jgi:hypothetical protein
MLGAVLLAEGAWVVREHRQAESVRRSWAQLQGRERQLAQSAPALTPENEQAMADDVTRLRRGLANRREELWPTAGSPAVGDAGAESVDGYFDLAAMMARLRSRAAAQNIVVRSDEYFGFEAYAREGPSLAGMGRVQRQSRVAEAILDCLFQSHPSGLLGVKREHSEPEGSAQERQARDDFVLPANLSLRRPGEIDTVAFRLEFRGETPALRNFLNALAGAPGMLVVRSVDVKALDAKKSDAAGKRGEGSGPVVGPGPCLFVVVVEAVRPPVRADDES